MIMGQSAEKNIYSEHEIFFSPKQENNMWNLFLDNSGSTWNRTEYWNKARDIVSNLGEDSRVFCWNSKLVENSNHVRQILRDSDSNGGTNIAPVASYCVRNKIHGNIIIITDGEIWSQSVREATEILKDHTFKKVKIYICGKNLSVGTAFSRNCEVELIDLLKETVFYSISNEDLKMLDHIEDMSYLTFNEKFDTLKQVVATQITGYNKDNPRLLSLRNKLIIMGKRLTREKRHIDTKAAEELKIDTVIGVQKSELSNDEKILNSEKIMEKLLSKYNSGDGDELQKKLNELYLKSHVLLILAEIRQQ